MLLVLSKRHWLGQTSDFGRVAMELGMLSNVFFKKQNGKLFVFRLCPATRSCRPLNGEQQYQRPCYTFSGFGHHTRLRHN
jgi:hypothetical protein